MEEIDNFEKILYQYEKTKGRKPSKVKLSSYYYEIIMAGTKNHKANTEPYKTICGIPFEIDNKINGPYKFVIS
ncbi:hypothetical protein [uncultured Clostridium sp.]|uniref:hypothetical protein n=1 Tax=uncultured Clostridium sp. TaxID=59620 RepID=UPI0028ECAE25|nr:hypothetical protein [uncultured Clostridium sp.]